jgi:threonine dehydrogenase-like Zn-dependent dehydrogenase
MFSTAKCLFPAGLFSLKRWALLLTLAVCFSAVSRAQLVVDCSGSNLSAFPSINAALQSAGPGTAIFVAGTCNEDLQLAGVTDLFIGAWYGTRVTLNGRSASLMHTAFTSMD